MEMVIKRDCLTKTYAWAAINHLFLSFPFTHWTHAVKSNFLLKEPSHNLHFEGEWRLKHNDVEVLCQRWWIFVKKSSGPQVYKDKNGASHLILSLQRKNLKAEKEKNWSNINFKVIMKRQKMMLGAEAHKKLSREMRDAKTVFFLRFYRELQRNCA
jgi:hypothetical protein